MLENAYDLLPNISKTAASELLLYPESSTELKPIERVLLAVLLRSEDLSADLSTYLCEELPNKKCLRVAGVALTVIEAINSMDRESALLRINR